MFQVNGRTGVCREVAAKSVATQSLQAGVTTAGSMLGAA